jgi:hypothetical protein
VKLARFKRPKASCSLSYVEYRPNTTSNIMKSITLREGHEQEREVKEGS